MFGFVPKGRYKKEFLCYARPARPGSWEHWFYIASAAGEWAIHAEIYNMAIGYVFGKTVDALKGLWTRPGESDRVIETLATTFQERAREDHDL